MRFEVIWETTARLARAVILGSERAHPGVRPRGASKDARKHLDRHPEVLARPLRPGEPRRMTDTVQVLRSICIALMTLVFATPVFAEKGKLRDRLTPEVMAVVYPAGAERLGEEEGSPPAIAVYEGDKAVAYLFSTLDIVAAPGYSSTPFDVIAGVDLAGRLTGAKVVFHNESYIVHDALRQRLLDSFLAREAGRPLRGAQPDALPPDFVAGATVSTRAMRAAVGITAGLVLRARLAR